MKTKTFKENQESLTNFINSNVVIVAMFTFYDRLDEKRTTVVCYYT
jgi:hypothetical protein